MEPGLLETSQPICWIHVTYTTSLLNEGQIFRTRYCMNLLASHGQWMGGQQDGWSTNKNFKELCSISDTRRIVRICKLYAS